MLEKKARRKKHQVLRAQPRATPVPSSRIDTENVELVDVSSDADDASRASKSAIVSPVEIDPRDIDSDISMQYERSQGHVAEEGKPNLRLIVRGSIEWQKNEIPFSKFQDINVKLNSILSVCCPVKLCCNGLS